MMLLFMIAAGAVSYASVQFLWYAPFAFGPEYLVGKAKSEDDVVAAVSRPDSGRLFFFSVVIPAFLTSMALVALKVITDRVFGTVSGFLLAVFAMGLAVTFPKYLSALASHRRPARLVFIQDGALLLGLIASAFAIIGSTV